MHRSSTRPQGSALNGRIRAATGLLIIAVLLLLMAGVGARMRPSRPGVATASRTPSLPAATLLPTLAQEMPMRAATEAPIARTPSATSMATPSATITATSTPPPTATSTPSATAMLGESGPYPALLAEIRRALASVQLTPLPAELHPADQNSTAQTTIFRWTLDWTPPTLAGLPGSQYRLPGGIPYQLAVDFELHPEVRSPQYINDFTFITPDDHLTFTGLLPSGVYHWRIRADYHSMLYRVFGPWSPWQRVEIP